MIEPGTVIDNRFTITERLGSGGFGDVYKAKHIQFGRMVALKILKTSLQGDESGLLRFQREAKSINAIKHKNVVSLYGYGVWQDCPYMVIEFLEGESLDNILNRQQPLTVDEVLELMVQVFDGLSCAHQNGVVHRDLKPSNVMIVPSNDTKHLVKLIDFGLALLMPGHGLNAQKLTETGYTMGTCHYMAPEQCLGGTIDHRADIYSAGCILYQCIAGHMPFEDNDNTAVMFKHIGAKPPQIELPGEDHLRQEALQAILDNCLAKDPRDRYQTAREAKDDLTKLISNKLDDIRRFSKFKASVRPTPISNKVLTFASLAAVCTALALAALTAIFQSSQRTGFESSSNEMAGALFRDFQPKNGEMAALLPHLEQIDLADRRDHRLTPVQRLKIAEWTLRCLDETSDDKARWDKQLEETLKLRAAMPRSLRNPTEELMLAKVLEHADRPELAALVLADLYQYPESYLGSAWAVECSRMKMCELLIYHGHLNEADTMIRQRLKEDLNSEGRVRYQILLGDIQILRHNYGLAEEIYSKQTQITHPYMSISLSHLTRCLLHEHKDKQAAELLSRTRRICSAEFGPDLPETLTLMAIVLAARQHDYNRARQLIDDLRNATAVQSALTRNFESFDRQDCVKELRLAGYGDLIGSMGPWAFPNSAAPTALPKQVIELSLSK